LGVRLLFLLAVYGRQPPVSHSLVSAGSAGDFSCESVYLSNNRPKPLAFATRQTQLFAGKGNLPNRLARKCADPR
jgi:hypothetical protein